MAVTVIRRRNRDSSPLPEFRSFHTMHSGRRLRLTIRLRHNFCREWDLSGRGQANQ